ncbi:MAG: transcription-repair coupling factor [Sedimentisphaerales bacterium]|nr:transcription-repair coupling factor [Sedimentisphaerales bacterium]
MELGRDKLVDRVVARLEAAKQGGRVLVEGTWGSFAPLLVRHISQQIKKPILYIRPHIDDADNAADDLLAFGAENVQQLPAWEGAEDIADATDEIRAERAKLVTCLSSLATGKDSNLIIPASIQALLQPVPSPDSLRENSLELKTGFNLPQEKLIEWLVEGQFERVDKVDMPGQFARRGGIVDIYPVLVEMTEQTQTTSPLRIEFFGDEIESIRGIDLDTQRSGGDIKNIKIISSVAGGQADELFINVLPENTLIVIEEVNDVQEVATVYLERLSLPEKLFNWEQVYKSFQNFGQLHISRFAGTDSGDWLRINVKSIQQFQPSTTTPMYRGSGHKEALEQLVRQARGGKKVYLYCEAAAEIDRVTEIIEQSDKSLPKNLNLVKGFINQGFVIESRYNRDTIVISHHELFGQFAIRRRYRPIRPSAPVDTLEDLQAGDYVVHASYGVGKFLGVTTIEDKTGAGEFLTLEYADKVKVQVSVDNIHLVQKYIGTSPRRPVLSKVGSKKWLKQKKKVEESVHDLAAELLELQAKRQAAGGIKFASDSNWQNEFEESFPYQETADQTTAVEQIKGDMLQSVAMDRLLCGDVGYGKTELAMRAAFKAVENGKQVAVLVPTTVLCVQHGRTFTERFADFPISIEVLNRFRTAKEARDIISRARKGKVDILIGTHRLLSKDVGFKDLGLLVIDEEQRFGVEHKEKLKKLRVDVDILTMTATPIPRTLHMSLLGLRDISSLGTPPLDRRAVVTKVERYRPQLVKDAVYREMNRQGQVFFLHNRVKTIEKRCWELRKLFNDENIKFDIAHGQMSKRQLETAMINFVLGKTDVLVCTTIIESGLDIPNANTIFIDDADRFGLAELHQLRGRVGRYKHRAYAYMLLPPAQRWAGRSITPLAARRLKAIEEYSHLGAGFRIALRDLEIRGAGNILGPQQSGHIQMVGYQMYCVLLAQAVKKLKGQTVEEIPATTVELGFSTYIPKNYIPADRSRMEVYRKIAVARNQNELGDLAAELDDVYGPVPEEVRVLLDIAAIRVAASKKGIKSIVASGNNLIFSFDKDADIDTKELFKNTKGKVDIVEPTTIYLRLTKNYFEPNTLLMVLRKIFNF